MRVSRNTVLVKSVKRVRVVHPSNVAQIPWTLYPGPQTQAALTEADELFYGGAAGGGKSALLLILAITQHQRSVIFRRTYKRLKALIEKSRSLLGSIARYNSNDKIWRGIPGDRTLEFGACEYEKDKEAWKGVDHDLKAFDEITEFTQSMYEFIIGWNRSAVPGQRSRVICTGNPPTHEEGEWILEYWGAWLNPEHPNPAKPGELRWYVTLDGKSTEVPSGEPFEHNGETVYPRSRTFIPASLDDNPALKDSGYRAVLQSLPEPLRSLLLYGKFDVKMRQDHPWQVIPSAWVQAAMDRWTEKPPTMQTALGVDVARGGNDETIIAPRNGYWVAPLIVHPGQDTPDGDTVASFVLAALQRRDVPINIDVVGVGSSPFDTLKRSDASVYPISGGERSEKLDRTGLMGFENVRSELWWNLRELLDPANGYNVQLPADRKLFRDLVTPRWTTRYIADPSKTSGNRKNVKALIKVEGKEEIKKRLEGRSPDRGDAVCYAFAEQKKASRKMQGWQNV